MVNTSIVRTLRGWIRHATPPVITGCLLIIFWQAFVQFLNIPKYLLPAPSEILYVLVNNTELFFTNAKSSISESISGFLLSVGVGGFLAILSVWSKSLGRAVMPFLIFSQSVPKISIAPLLLVWFGFGMTSKVLIVFMMTFFPIFISMLTGLRSIDEEMLDMFTCMGPTTPQVFIKLRIPNSLPYVINGFKLAAIRSVLAAIVAEWISSDQGLGYLLMYADGACNTPLLFATVVMLSSIGISYFIIVIVLGRFMIPWYFAMRQQELL